MVDPKYQRRGLVTRLRSLPKLIGILSYGALLCNYVTQIGIDHNLPVCAGANSMSAPVFIKNGYEIMAMIKVADRRPGQEASMMSYVLLYTPSAGT